MTEQEMQSQLLAYAQKQIPMWVKIALAGILLALLCTAASAGYYYFKHEQAALLTQQQLTQSAELAKKLDITQGQATKLAAELAAVQDKPPEIRYVVQAPTVEQAAVQVKKDIDAGKSPANKIPADKTVVTPNTKDQKVDVYRITLDKARWGVNALVLAGGDLPVEVGGGVSYHNKSWGISAGATNQRRYYVVGTWYFN